MLRIKYYTEKHIYFVQTIVLTLPYKCQTIEVHLLHVGDIRDLSADIVGQILEIVDNLVP